MVAWLPVAPIFAQTGDLPKGENEVKGVRLPGPGERTTFRIGPAWMPESLSLADPPAPRPGTAAVLPPDGDAEPQTTPPNNTCSTATNISNIGEWAFDCTMATMDGLAHFACNFFGQSQIDRDVWFRWTAPITASYIAETCAGVSFDSKMAVYREAACPPGDVALLACNDDACGVQSRVTFSATAGQRYFIRIGSYPGSPGGAGTFRIRFQSGQTACAYNVQNCQPRDPSDAFDATGRILRDDFSTVSNGSITGLCFWGTYYNGITDCQSTAADQFFIYYYYDVGGVPSGTWFQRFDPGQYTKIGPIPTGNLIDNIFPEYAYSITHQPIPVSGNECYWVTIENRLPPPPHGDCAWYWERGVGNMIAYRGSTRIAEDLAFCVSLALDPPTVCQQAATPPNDSCANAEPINCGTIVFDADNLFASTAASDPPFTCRFGGAAQGIGTIWYRFQAFGASARVSLCGNPTGDTLVAVYSGTCGNLTQIACNDDACGFKSQVCATGLTFGQTYYIQLASYDESSLGQYELTLDCPCPSPPANDACANATLLSVPANISASTRNATADPAVPSCGFSVVSSPGVWYRVVGNGSRYKASLCGGITNYDTKISILCGSCPQPICAAFNDDGMPSACGLASEVEWCTASGQTYYIFVHGFNGAVGDFTLAVTAGQPCSPAVACAACEHACPPNSVQENESCGGNTNGGCNVVPPAVQNIQCGQTICGTMQTIGVTRDTDWYQFTLNIPAVVTWSVQSESPVEAMILDTRCPPQIIASATTLRCGTAAAGGGTLPPGTYRAFVAAVYDGYPCGNSSDYLATLTCVPLGSCCVMGDCQRTTQAQCAALMGQYGGDGAVCPITYSTETCSNPFEDISPTGMQVVLADDQGATVPLGFTFRFFGVDYTSINLSSNGYLTFDPESSEPINRPIPDTTPPNALIAPFWTNLAPNQSSRIHYQTLGSAPDRRFIAQWKNVPRFLHTDANTFQAVLYESSRCIEFRYGIITPPPQPGAYTVGVENQSGVNGTAVNASTISSGSCFRLCPILSSQGCILPPCPGDADGNRVVNFADIVAVLTNWGLTGSIGDANHDGVVNFADATRVLENWGLSCPTL